MFATGPSSMLTERDDSSPGVRARSGGRGRGGCGPAVAALLDAVDELSHTGLDADGSVLSAVHGVLDRLTALVAEAEVRFDRHEVWRDAGAGSLRGWLADACGMSRSESARMARRVQRLESWPEVADAWCDGQLNGSQVEAIVSVVPRRFVGVFAEHAATVVPVLSGLDAAGTEMAMRQWVRCAEAADGPDQLVERASGLHLSRTFEGRVELSGDLSAGEAAILEAALRDFAVADVVDEHGVPVGPPRSQSQRDADALLAAVSFALAHRDGPSDSGRFLPHVSVVVDVAELRAGALRGAGITCAADLEKTAAAQGWSSVETAWFTDALTRHGDGITHDGELLDAATLSMFTCDSVMHRVLTVGSKVLDLGRDVRTATAAQRRAIIARDRHCRAPGCRTKPKFCEIHHVDPWHTGGRTDVGRMVLLCGTHHRLFHRLRCRMHLDDQATFTVHLPDGRARSTTPHHTEHQVFARMSDPAASCDQASGPMNSLDSSESLARRVPRPLPAEL